MKIEERMTFYLKGDWTGDWETDICHAEEAAEAQARERMPGYDRYSVVDRVQTHPYGEVRITISGSKDLII